MNTREEDPSVQPAISVGIDLTQTRDRRGGNRIESGSSPISDRILKNVGSGSEIGDDTLPPALPESLSSTPSVMHPRRSNKTWHTPANVRELAGQANQVATMVLNGTIDMEVARSYGALVRGIAQMMSIEVTRARFVKTEPILTFEEAGDDE